jgi:hypothetical protein
MSMGASRRGKFGAIVIAVAVVIGATGLAALPASAAPPGAGSISGRVIDTGGNPLSNICVNAAGASGTTTDLSGAYSLTGLPTGTYQVSYSDCNPNPTYLGQWYLGHTDQSEADPVAVTDLVDTPLGDVTMVAGVAVSGTVTDGIGTPIPNVNVSINGDGPGQSGWAQTASDGTYRTGPVPNGSYRVQFSPNDPQYASEFWNDKPSWNTADLLSLDVGNGTEQTGIDAQLAAAAIVEGTVTDSGGTPQQGVCVEAAVPNDGGWDWVGGSVQTQSDGTYSIGGLPAIDVRIHFRDCTSAGFVDQWYAGTADFNSSTPVNLVGGATRSGIDAQMVLGTMVSGSVTDSGGNPIPNVNVGVQATDDSASSWVQTNPAGVYTTNALPPGTYTVQFQGTPSFAGEYWNDKLIRNDADILTITGSEGPVLGNIDAVLAGGATISGRVIDESADPVQNLCVYAVVETSDGVDGVAWTGTGADGTYTLSGVPPTTVKVVFQDCNGVGPYVQQWWQNATDQDTATPLTPAVGDAITGIDAQLVPAGAITGRVTDAGGNPIEGVCAQATTTTSVGNLATTDSNGDYAILLPAAGDFKVQFVDCDRAGFAGEWWNDQPSSATAQAVHVDPGQVVTGVDASLAPGATGTISGKVVNAGGTPMTSACVIAYLPNQFVLFAAVQPDGSYTIPDVPSGTYALAFLGCGSGDPEPTVPDPDIPGVEYSAFWWNAVPLDIQGGSDGGPDPIAQGANLVTVTPGTDLVGYDGCFGCQAITITSITPGPNSLTVAFTTPFASGAGGSAGGAGAGVAAASLALDGPGVSVSAGVGVVYTVTCSGVGGGSSGSASGPGSPITVTGLTSGGSYICRVAAAADGVVFATSAESDVLAAGVTASGTPEGTADPGGTRAGVTGSLPRTGTAPAALVRAGFLLLVLGLVLTITNRRRGRTLSELE